MTTVAEIESAIEQLPSSDYSELLAWIEERQILTGTAEALFSLYDEEEQVHAKG